MQSDNRRRSLENAVIFSLVQDPSVFERLDAKPSDFKLIETRGLFEFLQLMKFRGEEIDFVIFSARKDNKFANYFIAIEGSEYTLPTSIYLKELREFNKQEVVDEAINKVGKEDPERLVNKILELNNSDFNLEVFRPADLSSLLYNKFQKASENPDALSGVTSGIAHLDTYTWGFQKKRVYIIAARPSMGKSALAMNIAFNAAMSGDHVYYQSLEESKESFFTRMISKVSKLRNEYLNKGRLNDGDFSKIINAIEEIGKLNISFCEQTGFSTADISRYATQVNSERKIDLIILDHLQEVREPKSENRRIEVTTACSNMRAIGKRLNVPVVLLCQLSRSVESRAEKIPCLSDLRESGDLEQIADVVMLLYRESYYNKESTSNQMEIIFAKNRDGRTGSIFADFDPSTLTVCNTIL